jgi:hypothetical protein
METVARNPGVPTWFVAPGEADPLAWVAFGFVVLALYGIVTAYAAFERWAEHHSQGTLLAKTIPTLLLIALLYELFPLDHFHPFLPLTAILLSLLADYAAYRERKRRPTDPSAAEGAPGDD